MLIVPAIDLKDGCVVRYVQGKSNKKIYSKDPIKTAQDWVEQGAQFIHVVDLDGAFTGKLRNLTVAKKIARLCNVPIEFGGGVRKLNTIKAALEAGIERVVLGTKAIENLGFLKRAYQQFGEKVIVSLDAKNNYLATRGWKKQLKSICLFDFANLLKKVGFKKIIYTDVLRDGTLSGPNIRGIKLLLKESGLEVIVSGGVSNLKDLEKLKKLEKSGVSGVIIGKALYEYRFSLKEALKFS